MCNILIGTDTMRDSDLEAGEDPILRSADRIRQIAIIGGGTAGWMAAANLAKSLEKMNVRIELVESEQIGGVGVGEATIPPIIDFIRQLGIDEDGLIREIKATFKLGIAFRDWTRANDFYFHPFGPIGSGIGSISFPAYWLRLFLTGNAARLEDYSIQAVAAVRGKFTRPIHAPNTPLNKLSYALHFDALLFSRYLRRFAENRGVVRTVGTVKHVALRPDDGFISSVILGDGRSVEADLFIDCTGFAGLLIGQALKTGYDDWTKWLPCDRALVVQTSRNDPAAPFTLVTGRDAGWQWRIPLQHRVGNGYVYGSSFISDEAAIEVLSANLPGEQLTDPMALRFVPGRRHKAWNKNCIALGLSSGFLEPLEATSIYLIQRGINMLLKFFPDRHCAKADTDRYNRVLETDFAYVRDFLLLHYGYTARTEPFWRHCRQIPQPDSLREKIELFASHGRILREEGEPFPVQSWLSVMIGQRLVPRSHDPMADSLDTTAIKARLDHLRARIELCADSMPSHEDFLRTVCSADKSQEVRVATVNSGP